MQVIKSGSQPTVPGPGDWFTGSVRIDSMFSAEVPGRLGGGIVTFEPGARTAWHTHPYGQTLVVIAGAGRVQHWDGPAERVVAGDVVVFAPGEKHWHGAAPTAAMTHIAVQESEQGNAADWLEHVTDEQYEGRD